MTVDYGFRSLFLAYDSGHRREVLVADPGYPAVGAVIWAWDGRSWQKVVTPHFPRGFTQGAYSPELDAFVGTDGTNYFYDTWLYDGIDWRSIRTTRTPFTDPTYVGYDPIRHSVVALSLLDYSTWTFDGKDWFPLPVHGATPAISSFNGRQSPAVALDQQRGLWVVFGGNDASGGDLSDTWVGDGSSWTQLSPATSPSARSLKHMEWDPDGHRLILFGGTARQPHAEAFLIDTWAWDGTTWTKLAG